MGDAKRKQYSRAQFLAAHPNCTYCGAPATTTDHFPPRCFFRKRIWPTTYEFPSCVRCQQESRSDEQVVAVLVRIPFVGNLSDEDAREWKKLVQGVKNNRPDILAEMTPIRGSITLRSKMREFMGPKADEFRRHGWGMIEAGSAIEATLHRFTVKLCKALYFRHNNEIFFGRVFGRNYNSLNAAFDRDMLTTLISIAPAAAEIERGSTIFSDQFNYRFNHSAEHGVLYAVVEFSPQFLMQILAIRESSLQHFETILDDLPSMFTVVQDCARSTS